MHSDTFTPRSFPAGDDLVERLVRVADPGPELPSGGAAAVKAAIRPEWQRQVARRRRSRQLTWTAGLAAAACLVLAVAAVLRPRPAAAPVAVASVGRVVGAASLITADGRVQTLTTSGQSIPAGAELRTDAASRVALTLAGGQSLRLDHTTSLRLPSAAAVELAAGAVYVDSGAGASGLAVSTTQGVATDVGTQFEVRSGQGSLVLRVREGSVRLDRAGAALEVPSGFEATVVGDGAASTRVVAPHDPAWGWAEEVAPSFAIEGQTAASFLAWVARETGRRIRFASPAAEATAAETRLHGSTEGLTPLEAAAVVLPSCGLTARVDGADLVVAVDGE